MLKYTGPPLARIITASLSLAATGLINTPSVAPVEMSWGSDRKDFQSKSSVLDENNSKGEVVEASLASKREGEPKIGVLADNGFRPEKNGFGFDNYGAKVGSGKAANLTKTEMRKLFGDGVCIRGRARGCKLTLQANRWMRRTNAGLDDGHCYGFAVASLLMWKKRDLNPISFGSKQVSSLKIEGNIPLQRQLAYSSASEDSVKVAAGRIKGTPSEILGKLIQVLKPDAPEVYSLGFYKRDHTDGHEVTPYAVKYAGHGKYEVLIYDSNYNKETRVMKFDLARNAWSYDAAVNPDYEPEMYEGGASDKTLSLDPASPSTQLSPAPFALDWVKRTGGRQG